jgi:outer membrane lipoprotein-sorting protein
MRIILLFFISLFPTLAIAQYDAKAEETLKQMSDLQKKNTNYKVDFTCSVHSETENIDESFTGNITVKGNKYKLQLADWQEVYNNGSTVWTYIKAKKENKNAKNEVTITNYEPETEEINITQIFHLYKKGFKYLYIEDEKIENEVYEVIDLTPLDKEKEYFKIRLWINKKAKTLKKFQIFDKSGKRTVITIQQLVANLKLEDNFFNFDKSKYKNIYEVDLR